ncbi:Lamin-B2 [Sesbania bispinosa]|nr:Lamin-B2 [Sesbania bispinosa]
MIRLRHPTARACLPHSRLRIPSKFGILLWRGPTDRPKAGGESSSEVPVLTRAVIFGDNFSSDHPAVVSQFYTEKIRDKFIKGEFSLDQCLRDAQVTYLQQISLLQFLQKDVVPAAERAKENYDKALKASTSATEECAKIKMEKEALTVQPWTIGKEKKDLEQKLGEMESLKKKVEDLGKDLLAAEERRKEDLRKQQEVHDSEVAELKRKLEAAIEGERKSVSDTLRYVEKAFDVAIEQVDGDKKIEVPPEGLPAATGAQTDA